MMYPTSTPVHTFLLDLPESDNIVATVVVVYIAADGEVCTSQQEGHRDAQVFCTLVQDDGGRILAVCEGEHDLGSGTASVWVG